MSYSGTVHCRNCYGTGHNRRTCPQLTEQYKKRAEREWDEGNGVKDGYYGTQYAKRVGTYIDGSSAKELKRTRRGGTRRCKYCAKTGHNTRTCTELKEAKATAITETRKVREDVLAALETQGLGVGALVTKESYGAKHGYMVIGFNWATVTAQAMGHNPGVINIQALNPSAVATYERTTSVPLPPIEGVNDNSWNQVELVAPVSGSAALLTVPEGWTEDQSWLEDQFEGAQSPNWHDNRYDY